MDLYKNAFFYVEAHSSAPIWPTEVFLTILESCDIVLEGYLGEKKISAQKNEFWASLWGRGLKVRVDIGDQFLKNWQGLPLCSFHQRLVL